MAARRRRSACSGSPLRCRHLRRAASSLRAPRMVDALIGVSEHTGSPLMDRGVFEVEAVRVVPIQVPWRGHGCDCAPARASSDRERGSVLRGPKSTLGRRCYHHWQSGSGAARMGSAGYGMCRMPVGENWERGCSEMLIIGFGVTEVLVSTLVFTCETCGNHAAHRLTKQNRKFSCQGAVSPSRSGTTAAS